MKKGNIKFLIITGLFMLCISGCSNPDSSSISTNPDNSSSSTNPDSSSSSTDVVITSLITFDKQGGVGGTASVTAIYGESMPNATAPTREGCSFEGYYDTISSGTKYYNADMSSARIWDKIDNATLYARWTGDTYTVTLDNQGGIGGTASVIVTYGESMPNAIAPTRVGCTFAGYYDAVSEGTKYYNADMSSARNWDKANNTTLCARWTGNTYTITLDMQGGSGGTESVTATYGESMPSAIAPTTRVGYTFNGYYDAVSGGTKYYNADMSSARTWDKTGNAALYARWTGDTYTVTLDNQGGTGGTASVIVTYGEPMPNAIAPTRMGYTFAGYYDAVSGGIKYYNADMSSARNWDKANYTTLCARWTGNTYTITLDMQGGNGGTESVTATYGESMPSAIAPTRIGYSFTGYYDAASGGAKYYNADMSSARNWDKANNTMLYARWTGDTFTITLDNQGGSGGTESVTATYGESMPTATAPTRVGYAFNGYYDAVSGGTKYYNADMSSVRTWDKTSNATLYARWTVNTYTITLNNQGGSGGTESVTATYGESMPNATAPTREGYIFNGYYDAVSGGTKYYNADMSSARNWDKANNTILYARWIFDEYYAGTEGLEYSCNASTCSITGYASVSNTVNIPMWHDGAKVTSIGNYAFLYCSSLTSITIPSSVTSIGYGAFSYCNSLETVTFENNSNLTSIGDWAFYNCSSLTSITIPSSVTSIGSSAFYDCSSLKTVTFENNSNLTSIGDYAFLYCSSLTSITIPSSVTSIGEGAFYGCSSLTIVTIPRGVTSIGERAFSECSLTSINVEEENQHYKSIDGVLFSKDGTTLIAYPNGRVGSYIIPSSVTSIGSSVFSYCSSLTSITIPSSVTSIGSSAFSHCSSLETVIFENNSNLTSIGNHAFAWCSNITSIAIPSGVTSIGGSAFYLCSSLETITFENDSKLKSIGNYAFEHCNRLTSITIPSGVTSIGDWAFYGCSSLTSITIPNSVNIIGSSAFDGWTSAQTIYIQGRDTAPETWDSYWKSGCSANIIWNA